jgi:hypothetical protein
MTVLQLEDFPSASESRRLPRKIGAGGIERGRARSISGERFAVERIQPTQKTWVWFADVDVTLHARSTPWGGTSEIPAALLETSSSQAILRKASWVRAKEMMQFRFGHFLIMTTYSMATFRENL